MNKIEILGDDFRKMQLLELDMLVEFDALCRKHSINYVIFGGTMLGAIRHQGYIPWDDDADIAMLREDYEKFREHSDELNPDVCYFQDHSIEKEYRWGYGKLRRTNTSFVRVNQEHLKCRNGIFVDVFPMDDIPKTTICQIFNDIYCFILRKILWSEIGKVHERNILIKYIYKILSHINQEIIHKKIYNLANKSSNSTDNRVRCLMFKSTGKLYKRNPISLRYGMPKEWFLKREEYIFENHLLYGSKDYDDVLKYIYGDYMILPSIEDREPHSPVSSYSFGDL